MAQRDFHHISPGGPRQDVTSMKQIESFDVASSMFHLHCPVTHVYEREMSNDFFAWDRDSLT